MMCFFFNAIVESLGTEGLKKSIGTYMRILSITRVATGIVVLFLQHTVLFASAPSLAEEVIEEKKLYEKIADRVRIFATIELEAIYEKDFENKKTDEHQLNVDLEGEVEFFERLWGFGTWAYDQEETELEELYVTLFDLETVPVSLSIGKIELPFALYDTNMVSDPFTLEIAETFETAVRLDYEYDEFFASVFSGHGRRFRDNNCLFRLFGASCEYTLEYDEVVVSMGAGWMNNIYSSDELSFFLGDENLILKDPVPGFSLNFLCEVEPFDLMVEYVSATDDPEFIEEDEIEKGNPPQVWNVELGYTFDLFEWETTVAFGYQGSDNALDFLPERRLSGGFIVAIADNIKASFEYAYDTDYSRSDGGTGEDGNVVSFQLELEF